MIAMSSACEFRILMSVNWEFVLNQIHMWTSTNKTKVVKSGCINIVSLDNYY